MGEQRFETPLLERILRTLREGFDPEFSFSSPGALPWSPLSVPLEDARVALVSTGGLHLATDESFAALERPQGDTSFRVVPHGTEKSELDLERPYVDPRHTARDPEVALPVEALSALANQGTIGSCSTRHYSFCGGIVRPLPGLAESARAIASMLEQDGVDAVLLLPTCSLCVQTVCLLARELEALGTPTVCLSLLPELSEFVGAPRTLTVHFPFGAPCGDPGNSALHRAVLREALDLLRDAPEAGTQRATHCSWKRAPALVVLD